jgi:hypothetical protein
MVSAERRKKRKMENPTTTQLTSITASSLVNYFVCYGGALIDIYTIYYWIPD